MIASRPASLDDSVALQNVVGIDLSGDTVAVIDADDRVLFFDRHLELVQVYGRSGQGPGEFRRPNGLRFVPGGLVVTDNLNSRATWLDRGLTVARTSPSFPVFGDGIVVNAEGSALLLPVRTEQHHLMEVDTTGTRRPWGRRVAPPAEFPGLPSGMTRNLLSDLIEPWQDGALLLDGESGSLLEFGPDGEVEQGFSLPQSFADEYFRGTGISRHGERDGSGYSISFRERFTALSVNTSGQIVFLRPGAPSPARDWVGGVIELERGKLFPLVSELPAEDWRDGSSVSAAALQGSELVLGTVSGALGRVRLEIPDE